MQPGGPVQQPYTRVDYIPQSGAKDLASELNITLFFPTQFSRTLVITSTGQINLSSVDRGLFYAEVTFSRSAEVTFSRSAEITFSRSAEDFTEVISIHRHYRGIPGYFVSGMMNNDM
jgi:hypothetical protein